MKVVPVKNFISRNILILSVILLATPHLAFADNQNDGGLAQNSWFVEGRYHKSLSETDGFYDADPTTARIVSATGESLDNLDATGIAIGRNFNEGKASISLGYDKFGTVNKKFATTTAASGAASCTPRRSTWHRVVSGARLITSRRRCRWGVFQSTCTQISRGFRTRSYSSRSDS